MFGVKEKIITQIDPELIRQNDQFRAVTNENASLKGLLAKYQSEEGKRREREQDKKEEENIKLQLNTESEILEKKIKPTYFSLKSFFNKIKSSKYKNLGFFSFDRSKKLADFGDIGFSSDGDFVVLDKNKEILIKHHDLKAIFCSLPGLPNEITKGMIPLNVTSEGKYFENIMIEEVPEITPDKEYGKFQYTSARKKPIYDYLNELRSEISEKEGKIEELEIINTKLQKKIDDLNVVARVSEDASQTARAELSESEQTVSSINRIYRSTEKELTLARDTITILEDITTKLENQFEIMRSQAEKEGVKLSMDKAMEQIQQIRRELVRDEPSREIKVVQVPAQNQQLPIDLSKK